MQEEMQIQIFLDMSFSFYTFPEVYEVYLVIKNRHGRENFDQNRPQDYIHYLFWNHKGRIVISITALITVRQTKRLAKCLLLVKSYLSILIQVPLPRSLLLKSLCSNHHYLLQSYVLRYANFAEICEPKQRS